MISMEAVLRGDVTLADLVGINNFLDLKADIEWAAHEKAKKEAKCGGHR